jgi:hypothetical protein
MIQRHEPLPDEYSMQRAMARVDVLHRTLASEKRFLLPISLSPFCANVDLNSLRRPGYKSLFAE